MENLLDPRTEGDFEDGCEFVLQSHGLVQDLQERLVSLDTPTLLVA